MKLELSDWDQDLPPDPDEEYRALVRTLKFTEGFSLLFARCSPAEGEQIIGKVKKEITNRNIEVLRLNQAVDNLYEIIDNLSNKEQINILFITGLEHSFYEYEECKALTGWNSRDIYSYSWKGVPSVLINLNQQRERFRDNFHICFVFLLPLFAIKYFIQRAPDFFDWRSGLFDFPIDSETLEQESLRILQDGDYEKYLTLTPVQRTQEILIIQELIDENYNSPSSQFHLLLELGNLQFAEQNYKQAIASYDQSLTIKANYYQAWHNRGDALFKVQRYEEAIISYDKVIKLKPENYSSWYKKGEALRKLGRYEEAITNYDKVIAFNPNDCWTWYHRGLSFSELGRYEDAIVSYDQALKINNNDIEIWGARGMAFYNLGNYEQALVSYDKATTIKPECCAGVYYYKACCFALQGLGQLAIENLQHAITMSPKKYREKAKYNSDFGNLHKNERFQVMKNLTNSYGK
ncbi:tetratricopeptide repeat protein [Halotia branconii]|uniref:Tetratricopeptide repeat protein n=1 Tax=Halotia branconii CENA392 TaxID=1539056 RepID=A0AAJ6PBH6_9CYAN|nr:tetratricopeptide repeat protein [Halotia branconii]WGV27855.1 tetratricopeptide repeat protein [Halotia branconii CENA392]